MTKVLLDGDIITYRAAYSTEGMTAEDTEHKCDELIEEIMEATMFEPDSECLLVYLTGSGNFRYDIATIAPYKGHRRGAEKPTNFQAARDYLVEAYEAEVSVGEEADDLISKKATELGPETIIASIDKDFLQVPCMFFNTGKKEFTKVTEFEGLQFFYTQVLTGDRADNIKGLQGIGPVKAKRIVDGATNEQELYEKVLEAYNGDLDALIENARLLWLRREDDQLWLPPDQR